MTEHEFTYGQKEGGWKNGDYTTAYVSANPKFYVTDNFYLKKKYAPFWNVVKEKYQVEDCGMDCEYLGPKNVETNLFSYIILFAVLVTIVLIAVCNQEKIGISNHNTPEFMRIRN
jgi:hypothetical protein